MSFVVWRRWFGSNLDGLVVWDALKPVHSTLSVVRPGVGAVTVCVRSAACGPARLILGLAMRSAALCLVAALLPLPTIIVSVSYTATALPARPMPLVPCAVVITPFMALRPHMSCLAETHAHVRPDRTDLLRARLPGRTDRSATPRQDRAS
jgi:hypothetical protein